MEDLRQNTLSVIKHEFAKALTDGIHFFTRVPWRVEEQNSIADFDFTANQCNQVDAFCLDIGADGAGRDGLQPKRSRVF